MKQIRQMGSRLLFVVLLVSLPPGLPLWGNLDGDEGLESFVQWLLQDADRLENVRFAEVVEAVSDCEVIAVDPLASADASVLGSIRKTTETMMQKLADGDHPIHSAGRINETSRYIEAYLMEHLNRIEGLSCGVPLNASGDEQRSGYPDLRIEHQASGRVFYLDPKVYKASSEASSFRTFYFEPKGETNKILDDASHLILGVAHKGKSEAGLWQFEKWQLIDLHDFRVRLKAEFQASNRDLYRDSAVLLRSDIEVVTSKEVD